MSDPNRLGTAAPIFRVSSIQSSVDYYVNVLGFHVNWRAEQGFACENDQGQHRHRRTGR